MGRETTGRPLAQDPVSQEALISWAGQTADLHGLRGQGAYEVLQCRVLFIFVLRRNKCCVLMGWVQALPGKWCCLRPPPPRHPLEPPRPPLFLRTCRHRIFPITSVHMALTSGELAWRM